MHPLSFLLKRGHLSAVATGRKMFERVPDMTPARFDLLYVIHERGGRARGSRKVPIMPQAELRRQLGLARQTVWKMVQRLVELGLLKKMQDNHGADERRILLKLTEEGIKRIRKAFGAAFNETYPLPPEAPADGDVPRYVQRLAREDAKAKAKDALAAIWKPYGALADDLAESTVPKKVGREVAKVFTAFAWARTARGRRGRRCRHLEILDRMIQDGLEIAEALGNTSELIYPLDYESDH